MDKREFLVGINSKINANDQENDELIKQILGDNKDSDAETCRIQCQVIRWNKENKNKWWHTLINPPESMSQSEFQDIAVSFGIFY